jgi:thiol-disulfide isomerase/thioredoxin
MKKIIAIVFVLGVALSGLALAQDKMMDDKMMMKGDKPTVVVIRADWCPYCKTLEPTMKDLMAQYGDRLNFVVLDITNEQTSRESAETAGKLGLGKFFEENKTRSATVAIFDSKKRVIFKAMKSQDREAYVRAFDSAIEKWKMQG